MGLSESQLKFFADYIEREIGIVYGPEVYFQLEQRLEKIAQFCGLQNTTDLYTKVKVDGITGDLKQFVLDIATNNETSFFRDPKMYQAFSSVILPSLQKNFPKSFTYRLWCCAASFGQEPYSFSMAISEFLKEHPGHQRFELLATDIADHALKRCKEAVYSQLEIQRGLSASRLLQNFSKTEEGTWKLNSDIKSMVNFKKQNLLDPFVGMGLFHVISCRYVLIYQDAERKKQILQKIEKSLAPNGYLILGASESAIGLTTELNQVNVDGAIFYQKKA
jgi:chemotaxis protein methyltransferase CheR